MFKLDQEQSEVLSAKGHLLVQGGPGSGKTTVSIIKASNIVKEELISEQKLLFLSFSRAAVSRVLESLKEQKVDIQVRSRIEVETYHSFFWKIIKCHSYLIGLPRDISVLTPEKQAIALSKIRADIAKNDGDNLEQVTKTKNLELSYRDGLIPFDLFGYFSRKILKSSSKLQRLLSERYPYIILDEFQDTNKIQWKIMKLLGKDSTLCALADPEQRIFDFIGADPKRLNQFVEHFSPREFNLKSNNYRSANTDISKFGDDVLAGRFSQSEYSGIYFKLFKPIKDVAYTKLITEIYNSRSRLIKQGNPNWSLVILVPTKKMTRKISEALSNPPASLTPINHTAVIDKEAVLLSAEIISYLLEQNSQQNEFETLIGLIVNYFQGKGGDKPSATNLKTAEALIKGNEKRIQLMRKNKKLPKTSIISKIEEAAANCKKIELTGIPNNDWVSIRTVLEDSNSKHLKDIANDSRNIRLLNRGTELRELLSNAWLKHGYYLNALEIIRTTFIQEHFSKSSRPETGVIVMNMHKAKGKQFDEVIIFEGWPIMKGRTIVQNPDRIVRANDKNQDLSQAQQNLRVSITRARQRTTIFTPQNDCCVLFTS